MNRPSPAARTADRVAIIGAGMAGIASAIRLSAAGFEVAVYDKAEAPGGKMRLVQAGQSAINGGPTVFTMKWVFERLLAESGVSLEGVVSVHKADTLARHAWTDGAMLDLFADIDRSSAAIESFSDARNADGYRRMCAESKAIFDTLKEPYIAAPRPGPVDLMTRIGLNRLPDMLALKPFSTMWGALGRYFDDPRLQQLFGRYATYCGSSPYMSPATLMLVAHVEQDGVWLVKGGMAGLAKALAAVAQRQGAIFNYGCGVQSLIIKQGVAAGLVLDDGRCVAADHVIYNGDVNALGALLGNQASVGAAKPVEPGNRSLSALTFCAEVEASAYPLLHHTVFFSDDYRAEFDDIFKHRVIPRQPTTYICAQDRTDDGAVAPDTKRERLLCLINAPADGDRRDFSESEIERCQTNMQNLLARCGLELTLSPARTTPTSPAQFNQLFPMSGGALYGRASHGWMASFQRAGAKTPVQGLYLAGGSVHPGPGVPMAALSGMQAAAQLVADRASMPMFRPVVTSGGMSTV